MEVLQVLDVVLRDTDNFSLSMLQLEAMHGIARLASLENDDVIDYIFGGPMRAICNLMIDPKNEKELRIAAENVLVACGFPGGAEDFQMCANDFENFLDWFTLRRSLKPQHTGHLLTERWVESLFSSASGVGVLGLNPNSTFMTISSSHSSQNAMATTQGSDLFELMNPVTGHAAGGTLTPERNRSPTVGLVDQLPSPEILNRMSPLNGGCRVKSFDRKDDDGGW